MQGGSGTAQPGRPECAGAQVPQFLLDAAIRAGRGAECNIVCTQPRRISAVGVASRVAQVCAPICAPWRERRRAAVIAGPLRATALLTDRACCIRGRWSAACCLAGCGPCCTGTTALPQEQHAALSHVSQRAPAGARRGRGRHRGLLRAPGHARQRGHPPPVLHHRRASLRCRSSAPTCLPRPARAVVPADLPPAAPAHWPMARPRPAGAPAACGERRGARAGVLLRRLQGDAGLAGLSHVVVDEVHERSADTDLLLLLLRDALAAQPGGRLRVVLMSATADVAAFARYFATGLPARPRRDAPLPPLARLCCQGPGRLWLPGESSFRWQASCARWIKELVSPHCATARRGACRFADRAAPPGRAAAPTALARWARWRSRAARSRCATCTWRTRWRRPASPSGAPPGAPPSRPRQRAAARAPARAGGAPRSLLCAPSRAHGRGGCEAACG